MINDGVDRPSLKSLISLALIGVALLPPAVMLARSSPAPFSLQSILALMLSGLGVVLLFYAGIITIWYCISVASDIKERQREIETITPRLRELEQIGRLTPEQIKIAPRLEHDGLILQIASGAPGSMTINTFFSTAEGNIPLEFIKGFLSVGGFQFVTPVSKYSEGTYNYEYARWFTNWLRAQGLAIGGEGSQSGRAAQWLSDGARAEVFNLFGVSMDLEETYDQ
jgi:hypothetical protein